MVVSLSSWFPSFHIRAHQRDPLIVNHPNTIPLYTTCSLYPKGEGLGGCVLLGGSDW